MNYEVDKTGVYSVSEDKENRGIITLNTSINKDELCEAIVKIIKKEIDKGTPEEEICIVAPQWYQIYPMANKLRKLLPDNHFDAPDISPIKYDPFNLFFFDWQAIVYSTEWAQIFKKKRSQ